MKRSLSLIFFSVVLLSLFACGSKKTSSGEASSVPSADSGIIATADVAFADANGESVYRVVRPNNETVTPLASTVLKALKDTFNFNIKNVLDTETDNGQYEILIGATNRVETAKARQYMTDNGGGRYDDWIICTIGKKIVIYSQNPESLKSACEYFVDNFIIAEGVKGGICHFNKLDASEFSEMTVNGESIGKFSVVRPHYNLSYLAQCEIDTLVEKVYDATGYMLTVEEDAYTEESDYEIVVGNTNRSGVESFDDYDHFSVTVSGKKVYLNGGNTYSTAMAVSEFLKMISDGTAVDADSVRNAGYRSTFIAEYDNTETYKPVWVDDFDGETVDPSKWNVIDEEYTSKDPATGTSGKNGKRAWRKPANVAIYDGYFHSILTQDEGNYYSGTIRTDDHMSFKYGYVETSSKSPQGNGFWNTLWMNGATSNGYVMPEIDVNESFGNSAVVDPTAHVWPSAAGQSDFGWKHREFDGALPSKYKYNLPQGDKGTFNDAFHTFGFLWTEDYFAFTYDGKVYCRQDLNQEGFEDFKLAYTTVRVKMILAASCGFCNCPLPQTATDEEWANSNIYYVDYVHLYQLDDGKSELCVNGELKK